MIHKIKIPIVVFLGSILLSLPVILPYLHSGYFPTHDGEWAVVRMGDMFRTLRDHQFPVRYSGYLNFQYGYPLFNFAYPMPYYLGTLLHFAHVGFISSVKTLFALSVIFSALGMFLVSRLLWKSTSAGIISSVLYVYLPYRLVDLYVRGSIGESLSLALFPILIYFVYKASEKSRLWYVLGGGILLAMLVSTHNIMTVLFLPILLLSMIERAWHNRKLIPYFALYIATGIGLSVFFWLPALAEKHLILLSQIPIADRSLYFLRPLQLILPSWGYGTPTDTDAFTYQLGIAQILGIVTALVLCISSFAQKAKEKRSRSILLLYGGILLGMMLLLFSATDMLWKSLPLLKEINYPWTLLAPLGFVVALLAGYIGAHKRLQLFGYGIALLAIVFSLPYAHPKTYIDRTDAYYLTNQATTTSSSELMPLWVKSFPQTAPVEKVQVIHGHGTIGGMLANSKSIQFLSNSPETTTVQINTIYYPGWQVFVDGKESAISYANPHGVMTVSVPVGSHTVRAQFGETRLRLIADIISLLSAIGIFVLFIGSLLYDRNRYAKK